MRIPLHGTSQRHPSPGPWPQGCTPLTPTAPTSAFFFSARREFCRQGYGCTELHGTPYAPKEELKVYPRRLMKCAAHQARQDGATAITTRRRHCAARSVGASVLSMERRCRSVVWDRKKVRSTVLVTRIYSCVTAVSLEDLPTVCSLISGKSFC